MTPSAASKSSRFLFIITAVTCILFASAASAQAAVFNGEISMRHGHKDERITLNIWGGANRNCYFGPNRSSSNGDWRCYKGGSGSDHGESYGCVCRQDSCGQGSINVPIRCTNDPEAITLDISGSGMVDDTFRGLTLHQPTMHYHPSTHRTKFGSIHTTGPGSAQLVDSDDFWGIYMTYVSRCSEHKANIGPSMFDFSCGKFTCCVRGESTLKAIFTVHSVV